MTKHTYKVWYMKPSWFAHGVTGNQPDAKQLGLTHVELKTLEVDVPGDGLSQLEAVFHQMQGEVWSPNGEARELIESKGLRHTSMSVGDIIVDQLGAVFLVEDVGFRQLET